jgi:hypothetical protein
MDRLMMNPPAIVGEVVSGRSAEVRKRLKAISGSMQKDTFDMAELLDEATNFFQAWGYEGLEDYATKELHIKVRKAQYLARISRVCRAVGVKRDFYEQVGVSKLREITRLEPSGSWFNPETKENEPLADHIANLIIEAIDMTAEAVDNAVAKFMGQVDENAMVNRAYRCVRSAWDNTILPAMELVRRKLGSAGRDDGGKAVEYSDGVCYEMMAAEYLADPNNQLVTETFVPIEGITVGTITLQEVPIEPATDI